MLSVYVTTEQRKFVEQAIAKEDRLSELVAIHSLLESKPPSNDSIILLDSRGISQPLDWENTSSPYLMQESWPADEAILLGLIFSKLDNGEKAWAYLNGKTELLFDVGVKSRLKYGYQLDLSEFESNKAEDGYEAYRNAHNLAIVQHYGYLTSQPDLQAVESHYTKALDLVPSPELAAYTVKEYATLLIDTEQVDKAVELLNQYLEGSISDAAQFSLKAVLTNAWMKQLTVPYDPTLVENLKNTLWEVLQYFEKQGRSAEAGLLYVDAAHIANISESFSESLGYITNAIKIFEEEELHELAGNAQLRKGTLLYTWAQNGNPQFYKPAIESYQQALQVFKQEETPDVFADIHHNLAVLYSEMPADPKKRGIWAGVASASFQEALNYFTKESFPYQYGMICNNFGNALTKFPPAIHSDNYEKALFYYQEALSVRTADYPYERAISLLNYLEASWNVSNTSDDFNEERYQDMLDKAKEVKVLVDDQAMNEEADKHLTMLDELKMLAKNA